MAVVIVIAIAGMWLSVEKSGNVSFAAGILGSNSIGIVNYGMLISQHPDYSTAKKNFEDDVTKAKTEFDEKIKTMSEKEKEEYYMQVQETLKSKKTALLGGVEKKVASAVKAAADEKGISIVIDKRNVLYGGQDITDDVVKKF